MRDGCAEDGLHVCVFSVQQELVKHTDDPTDKSNLRVALDAMKVTVLSRRPAGQLQSRRMMAFRMQIRF